MILQGNQRAGAKDMALHLLNTIDNEQVEVHEVRGTLSPELMGGLQEMRAAAKGTQCKQYLFSCSFSPPIGADASITAFEEAFDRAEEALGLTGQPRVVVFHEKQGRRHAHVVWSRIDTDKMKAINLPHYKRKLNALARDLFIEHEWELPKGFQHLGGASLDNFTMAQWQQAQRYGLHPSEIKDALRQCWERSDGLKSFSAALTEKGYRLAKGDQRGFVAVDLYGEVYSIPKWLGLKTKEIRTRLGESGRLPSVGIATEEIKQRVKHRFSELLSRTETRHTKELEPLLEQVRATTMRHREERQAIELLQAKRHRKETAHRLSRFRNGWRGIWDRLTERYQDTRRENENETMLCKKRDVLERQVLIAKHLKERRRTQLRIEAMRERHRHEVHNHQAIMRNFLDTNSGKTENSRYRHRNSARGRSFSR